MAEIAADGVGIDQGGLELPERIEEHVGEACRRRGVADRVESRRRDRSSDGERALRPAGDGTTLRVTEGDLLEDVVEGAYAAREQRRPTPKEVSLDALDVAAVRHDEPGIAIEHAEVALEEQRNLAGVRRPDDERKGHLSMVVPASDAISYATRACVERAGNTRGLASARLRCAATR